MLTEKQYQALCKYRDSFIPASDKPDDMTLDLLDRRFIAVITIEYTKQLECEVTYQKKGLVLTNLGKVALEEFEHTAQNNAKHDKEKRSKQLQAEKDKKQSFRHDFVVAGFSVFLTLVVQHIQEIFDFIQKIFCFFIH